MLVDVRVFGRDVHLDNRRPQPRPAASNTVACDRVRSLRGCRNKTIALTGRSSALLAAVVADAAPWKLLQRC